MSVDLGTWKLSPGRELTGRVTSEGSGDPIVRTRGPAGPLGAARRGVDHGWETGRMEPQNLADADLSALVADWLDWAETAEQLGVTVAKVRTMIREH